MLVPALFHRTALAFAGACTMEYVFAMKEGIMDTASSAAGSCSGRREPRVTGASNDARVRFMLGFPFSEMLKCTGL